MFLATTYLSARLVGPRSDLGYTVPWRVIFPNPFWPESANSARPGLASGFDPRCKHLRREPVPGIVGLITKKPRDQAEQELHQMLKAIQHHSFYRTGTWIDELSGIYVGWTAHRD